MKTLYRRKPLSGAGRCSDRRSPSIFRAYRVIYTIIIPDSHPFFSLSDDRHAPPRGSRLFRIKT